MSIFFKILLVLQNYPSTHFKTDQNIFSIEKLPDFDSKEYEICLRWKKCILKQITLYQNHWISFAIKLLDVDLVLAKISQIDPRLTFNLFHIFNHGRIGVCKVENPHWWYFWGLWQSVLNWWKKIISSIWSAWPHF